VFDGEAPASKVDTNAKREANRNKFRQRYAESVAKGCVDPTFLAMAFDVHGEARLLLIAALQINNFDYIQAPGEADTQLIQCFKENSNSIIVTIDADLLYYWVPGIRIMDWSKFRPGMASLT
jgi:5'-3' exonuclease